MKPARHPRQQWPIFIGMAGLLLMGMNDSLTTDARSSALRGASIGCASASAADSTQTLKGDFDGDGKAETAYFWPPTGFSDSVECQKRCKCKVQFFNPRIPDLLIPECYGGRLVNEGDLNQDGADEIGILPEWFSECWRTYRVYTLRDGVWKDAFIPLRLHCQIWGAEKDLVVPAKGKPGWVDVVTQMHHDEGYGVSQFTKRLKVAR